MPIFVSVFFFSGALLVATLKDYNLHTSARAHTHHKPCKAIKMAVGWAYNLQLYSYLMTNIMPCAIPPHSQCHTAQRIQSHWIIKKKNISCNVCRRSASEEVKKNCLSNCLNGFALNCVHLSRAHYCFFFT